MMVDWCETGTLRFTDPFFRETIERALAKPSASLFRRQTPIETLEELTWREPFLAPSGFIFHSSRCGSTLLTQMLAALPSHRVHSEPGLIEDIVRMGYRRPAVSADQRATWLRWTIAALGRGHVDERRYFVKFEPQHIVDLPLLRQAFPDVPFVFCVRDPLEILVSQSRQTGGQFVVTPLSGERFGIDLVSAASMPRVDYMAHVLGRVLQAGIRYVDDGDHLGYVVEYSDLPGAVDGVLDHFGVAVDEAERAAVAAASAFNAKVPGVAFTEDSSSKSAEASDGQRAAAERIRPMYDTLLSRARVRMGSLVP